MRTKTIHRELVENGQVRQDYIEVEEGQTGQYQEYHNPNTLPLSSEAEALGKEFKEKYAQKLHNGSTKKKNGKKKKRK